MNSVRCKTFTANATFGLHRGYSQKRVTILEFKEVLLIAQKKIKSQFKVELSAKMIPCEILFLGQEESSIQIEFIQYPKFLQDESLLKKAIESLVKMMMLELEQNRVVIIFTDETLMLEQSDKIDPSIQL